jgi:hypothetical protein
LKIFFLCEALRAIINFASHRSGLAWRLLYSAWVSALIIDLAPFPPEVCMLKRSGLFLMLSLGFLACKPLTKLKEEKNFRLYVESEDAALREAVKVLVI